jgi:hypothetical protein
VDHEPHTVRGRVSSDGSRVPSVLAAAIAAFLILAVVKPWSFGGGGPDSVRPTAPGTLPAGSGPIIHDEPSPSATVVIADPDGMACLSGDTDQLVAIERWPGHEIRSWVATSDTIASGPLDKHIVTISIFSTHVTALGMCAERAAGAGSPDGGSGGIVHASAKLLDVRSIVETAAGQTPVDLGAPVPIPVRSNDLDAARLYGPPNAIPGGSPSPSGRDPSSSAAARPRTSAQGSARAPTSAPADVPAWPLGAYAIAFRFDSDPPDLVRWVRLDIIRGAGEGRDAHAAPRV